jgi:G:T/U-mismatch repair DNA glycosylase
MYSLDLIIFVVSEKKAFEHFKLPRNDYWKVLYKFYAFYADWKSKMAATAEHRLTLDPKGKCSNAFFIFP